MKVFLISHVADADGVTPVILTDLVFDSYDYHLLEPSEVDDYMIESINYNLFDDYDFVFVTDLCFTEKVAEIINNSDLKNKLHVLDHHHSRIDLNKYDFIDVIEEINGRKESGTSLYYEYLLDNYRNEVLSKKCVSDFVDLVRSGDTWEWKKTNNFAARDISTLLSYYGNDKFIEKYKNYFRNNNEFSFDEIDNTLIEIDRRKMNEYIENCKDKVIFKEIKGYRVGIIFAELYRSELGNDLADYYKEQVDFIMIINMNRSISFRGIKPEFDLSLFAGNFNGYGHKLASGAPLPVGIKEAVIEYILKDIK